MSNEKLGKHKLSDSIKVLIFRWWATGAVYFFIGFGTALGSNWGPERFTYFLAIIISILTILIFDPVMFAMYDIKKHGVIVNSVYKKHTIFQGVLLKLLEVLRCSVCVVLVSLTYYFINSMYLQMHPEVSITTVRLPTEPFLFATFYVIYYQLFAFLPSLYVYYKKNQYNQS